MIKTSNKKATFSDRTEPIVCGFTALYFFICFFEPYLNQKVGSLMKFYIFGLALLYIIWNRNKVSINFISKSYFLWFVYKVITLIWTRDYYIFKLHFISHIGIVLLVTCLVSRPVSKKTLNFLTGSLWAGSLFIGILSLLSHTAYEGVDVRQVLTLFGVYTDPNNQAAFLLYAIAISLYYIIVKKRHFVIGIASIFINMTSLMMTASRGGLFAVIVIMLFSVFFMPKNVKTKIFALIMVLIAIFLIIRFSGIFVSTESWNRLFIPEGYEGGSGRINTWKNTLNLLNSNYLYYIFGAGWGANWGYKEAYVGIHNTYLSHLCDTGIIGFLLFHYPIFKCLKYFWKRKQYLPIIIALAGLLPAIFLDTINKRFFWNSLIILFMYFMNAVTKKKEYKE